MNDLCVTPHDSDRRALPALRLCGGCRDGLEKDLTTLPRLHHDLGIALATPEQSRTVHFGTLPGAGNLDRTPLAVASTGLPINPRVADLRDQIRHDLVWWAVYVGDERGHALPADEVPAIAAWLLLSVDWIAATLPAAQECPPVMRGLTGRARALLQPDGAKRIAIGACHQSVESGPCKGTLWATCRAEDDKRPSEIYCDGPCGTKLGAEQWRRFGREYLREGKMAG
jgi:hypothetical protein